MKTTIVGTLLSLFLLMAQRNNGTWTNIDLSPATVQAIAVDPRGTGTIFSHELRTPSQDSASNEVCSRITTQEANR